MSIDTIPGGTKRVAAALDACTTKDGPLAAQARAALFDLLDAKPNTRAAWDAWMNARLTVIHYDPDRRPGTQERNLWVAVSGYLDSAGITKQPGAKPKAAVILAAIERAVWFVPASEVIR